MKKTAVVCLLLAAVALFTACGRADLTAEEFSETARASGFTVEDVTAELEGNVETALLAYTQTVQIEFYVVATERQAKQAFDENRQALSSLQPQPDIDEGDKWAGEAEGEYRAVTAAQKTFLYVSAPPEEKEQVNSFLEAIGY